MVGVIPVILEEDEGEESSSFESAAKKSSTTDAFPRPVASRTAGGA